MKSDKLQDAIGLVDAKLIERAGKHKRKMRYHFKWIAAVLAVLIGVGAFYRINPLYGTAGAVIVKAEYPAVLELSNNEDEADRQWREYLKSQRKYYGAGKDLDGFFQATMSEFLTTNNAENRVYSPLNIYMTLAILAEITDGNNRQQILDLLDVSDIETLRTQANNIWNANHCDSALFKNILAGSVWIDQDLKYNKDTLNTLANIYYTSSFQGKMGSKAYNKQLQDWLNEQTGGSIKDLVAEADMSPNTIAAIFTTAYLRSGWYEEFSKSKTVTSTFHSPQGDVTCDFMNSTETSGTIYWGEQFVAINKPLMNGKMQFILPDEGISVNDLLKDSETLAFMTSNGNWTNCKQMKVHQYIPKFTVSSELDLNAGLQRLGVTDVFKSNSQLPLLCQDPGAQYDFLNITHSARVTIDEKGIEAATFAKADFCLGLPPNLTEYYFVADRPFIFVITNNDGLPLFTGVVNQP